MENENVVNMETVDTEAVTQVTSGQGLVVAAGIGLTVLVGGLAYKFAVKPLIAKIKAKKEEPEIVNGDEVFDVIEEPED